MGCACGPADVVWRTTGYVGAQRVLPGRIGRLINEPAQRREEACCIPVRGLLVPQVRVLFGYLMSSS